MLNTKRCRMPRTLPRMTFPALVPEVGLLQGKVRLKLWPLTEWGSLATKKDHTLANLSSLLSSAEVQCV